MVSQATRATGKARAPKTSTRLRPQGPKPRLPGPESSQMVFDGPRPRPQALPGKWGQWVLDPRGCHVLSSCESHFSPPCLSLPPPHPPCPSIAPTSTVGILPGLPTFPSYPIGRSKYDGHPSISLLSITVLVQTTSLNPVQILRPTYGPHHLHS